MSLGQYIKDNWKDLPHSSFNDKLLVMVKCVDFSDGGYGHHHYEGYGYDVDGELFWAYSSGCSCDGRCETEHRSSGKVLNVSGTNFDALDPKSIAFESLRVEYSDY